MNAPPSPVNARSAFSVAQFCAETLMFEHSRRSATLFSAVKTGAMITAQWFAFATSGLRASAVETESPTVLYIFQFRSEERRVGKECRSRWSQHPYNRRFNDSLEAYKAHLRE